MSIDEKYFKREEGTYVKLLNGFEVYCFNISTMSWEPNQEWFETMFIDGEDMYEEVTGEEVKRYIDGINTKQR